MNSNEEIYISSNQLEFNFEHIDQIPSIEPEQQLPKESPPEEQFKYADIDNIKNMLPFLENYQQDNVLKAEIRFETGKGILFTDGTGTGKTFTGLGICYRFAFQGKWEQLIVVPTDQKCIDWIEEAKLFGIDIYHIKNTKDAGKEISITTYANYYQNEVLKNRVLDLIIYDESHYLGQNHSGEKTVYFEQHKEIANLPSACRSRAREMHKELIPDYDGSNDWYTKAKYYDLIVRLTVERFVLQTKVVFLSATPFAYHKSIQYADGTLLDIEEKLIEEDKSYRSYNDPTPFGKFLMEHFGYQMKYNKITIPETGVDVNLLEREFFEKMKAKGIMSTNILQLEKDYSRDFITLDSDLGDFINDGIEMFYEEQFKKTFPTICEFFKKKYNYMYVNQLLECIKAREVIPRIRQHLELGRKVVIFHSYNHAAVEHPFRFDAYKLVDSKTEHLIPRIIREEKLFAKLYPEYYNLDLSGLENTRDAIKAEYPELKEFNGTIPKKKRAEYLKDFNDDNGETNILLVQQKAGKEGISLHDKTGKYQRVLIQLGLPTEPTGCIQIEGRTYRRGVRSNAPYEYMTLQTSFERIAFGEKIALRSRTAENLALGNLARNLENSFKEGYLSSSYMLPSLEQGTGGKEMDKFDNTISPFDKAKTYYYTRAKRNAKTKAKEGGDYYATPEPLGLKMVQWAKPQSDESGLEPSAGHGAIARFFPGNTNNHFIEQNINLTGELCINAIGTVKIDKFENHSIINKYNFIVMNPPFGTAGKLAMEHLEKAMLRHTVLWNSRIIAIVPAGESMYKRLKEFFASENGKKFFLRTVVKLPSCTFEQAGTKVSCNVIEIIKRTNSNIHFFHNLNTNLIDLTHIETIKDFFNEIEHLEL